MKYIQLIALSFAFLLFSCKKNEETQKQEEPLNEQGHIHHQDHGDHDHDEESSHEDGPVWENFSLPEGFSMDNISEENKKLLASREIQVPLSGNKKLDAKVKARVEEEWDSFKKGLKDYVQDSVSSSFWVIPEFLNQGEGFISYLFYKSTMHMGHAHPMHEYFSINLDTESLNEIKFDEVFLVDSPEDSAAFLKLVNAHIDEHAEVKSVYDYTFNLGKDFVLFSFDAYEAGPYAIGAPRSMVPTSELRPYLRPGFSDL